MPLLLLAYMRKLWGVNCKSHLCGWNMDLYSWSHQIVLQVFSFMKLQKFRNVSKSLDHR